MGSFWFESQDETWTWRVEPMTSRLGYWIYITKGLVMTGPGGGPYMCFGSRKRAVRKAQRIMDRLNRVDERKKKLTLYSEDNEVV